MPLRVRGGVGTLICDDCGLSIESGGLEGWVQCKAIGRRTTLGPNKLKNVYFCSRTCLIRFFGGENADGNGLQDSDGGRPGDDLPVC